jgi:predicted DNA-binding protein with PD1-like motif
MPPVVKYYTIDEQAEIGSISGTIVDHEPHLHIDIGIRDKETYIGHLEPDSLVLLLAEVCILKFNDVKMKRLYDDERKIALLEEA